MSCYEILISSTSEFSNLEDLIFGLRAQPTIQGTLLVNSSNLGS